MQKEESEKMSALKMKIMLIERIIEDFIEVCLAEEGEKSINLEDSGSSKLLSSKQEEHCNLLKIILFDVSQ